MLDLINETTYELVPRDLRTALVEHKPPSVCGEPPMSARVRPTDQSRSGALTAEDGGDTNVSTDDEVPNKEPTADERLSS